MKKTLRFSLLALLALFGMGSAMAEDFKEVITLNDAAAIQALGIQLPEAGKGTKVESITKGEVTIAATTAQGKTDTRIYQGSGQNEGKYDFRIYANGTLTFTAGNYFVKKIEFTGNNLDKLSGEGYTNGTWIGSGSDRSITLTATGTATIFTITVTYGESGAVQAEPGETAETAISVSEALAIIDQLADKETTSKSYYVKGTVASVTEISVGYGNATFVLGDGSTNNLTAYQLKGFNNEKINNAKLFKENDELIVVGKLQKFVDNSGATTPEIKSGYIYSVNGQTEDNTPSPEETVKAGKVGLDAENPMTVDQALAYINDFPANYKTEGKYYVEGTVRAIEEISTENGNATFTIAASQINAPRRASFSELVAYRLKGLENQAIVEDDYLKVGDEVVVCAQLQNYKDEKAELSGGYIYKKNGVTTGIQAITVDDAKAPVYSLDGRRVDESYRGVVIKNGKKYVK